MLDDLQKSSQNAPLELKLNRVSQLVNETLCTELVVATHVSLHKAEKNSASEMVSILHSDKEVAAKIKKTIASEVSKPIAYYICPMKPWVYTWTLVSRNIPTNFC